jgi:hypothetical protein
MKQTMQALSFYVTLQMRDIDLRSKKLQCRHLGRQKFSRYKICTKRLEQEVVKQF